MDSRNESVLTVHYPISKNSPSHLSPRTALLIYSHLYLEHTHVQLHFYGLQISISEAYLTPSPL